MLPKFLDNRKARFRNKTCLFHGHSYKGGHIRKLRIFNNFGQFEENIISVLKYCISPKDYRSTLVRPTDEIVREYQEKFGLGSILEDALGAYVKHFNGEDSDQTIRRLIIDQNTRVTSDECVRLSGSIYLRLRVKMKKLRPEHRAYRINNLFYYYRIMYGEYKVAGAERLETFFLFIEYLKDSYCIGRRH